MAKYRVLSLDGGGLRGLITARLLDGLNSNPAIQGWLDSTDLFVGTSTGGILALGLADGKSPKEIYNLYKDKGREIFQDSLWDNLRDLGNLVGAKYSNHSLKAELSKIFNGKKLGDLEKKVAIPTFDLDNKAEGHERTWKPKIFHNFQGADSDANALIANVALYTSSAPTYFPSADGFIDGGVFASNPSIVGLAQAISGKNQPGEKAELHEVVMLSIGTGVSLVYIEGQTLDWGFVQWAKPIIDVLMDGVAGISDYQARQLLGNRYHRLQIVFDPNETIPMDAVDKLDRMDDIANQYIKNNLAQTIQWIANVWQSPAV